MPKYLLLKHYNGGPEAHENCVPMSEWTPDEIQTHIEFQRQVGRMLQETGEFVDAQGLAPTGSYVRFGGPDAAPVTDGPFPETKEVLGGYYLVEAASLDEALTMAKAVPAPFGGLEVRPIDPMM